MRILEIYAKYTIAYILFFAQWSVLVKKKCTCHSILYLFSPFNCSLYYVRVQNIGLRHFPLLLQTFETVAGGGGGGGGTGAGTRIQDFPKGAGVETRDTKCEGGGGGDRVLSASGPIRKAGGWGGGGCCPLQVRYEKRGRGGGGVLNRRGGGTLNERGGCNPLTPPPCIRL